MRRTICGRMLLAGVWLMCGPHLWGQQYGPDSGNSRGLQVAVLYDALYSNVVRANQFWMQGGSIQVYGQFWRGLGVEADVSGVHAGNANNAGVGLNLVATTFGPHYGWSSAHRRYSLFGHALVGEAHGFDSVFSSAGTTSSSADGLAFQMGGGMDVRLKRRFSLRVFEADWLRTQLPNADTNVQNSLRLAAGVVLRFR
ncbi:MAG TPA: hypothetical protein VMB49_00580 [Acidobacteriaceae bacterium]|nr:hypothetical protein [Acidobacteriaceae bacterium]